MAAWLLLPPARHLPFPSWQAAPAAALLLHLQGLQMPLLQEE